jgi:hypothetical protein
MARNAYGFDLIGVACLSLAVLFVIQLVWRVISEYGAITRADAPEMLELVLLSLLTLLFGFRAFYIYVNYSEIIFNGLCALQIFVYSYMGYKIFGDTRKSNKPLANNLVFFYSSILLSLLSIAVRSIATWSLALGVLALLTTLPIFISVGQQKKFEVNSKSISLLHFIVVSKNKAGLLFLFFISSALFTGLNYWGVIPSIENVDRPKDYIELINRAEAGKEKPVNGQYQHAKYKAAMDKFVERHGKQ